MWISGGFLLFFEFSVDREFWGEMLLGFLLFVVGWSLFVLVIIEVGIRDEVKRV